MLIQKRMYEDELRSTREERDLYKIRSLDFQQQVGDVEGKARQEVEEAKRAIAKLQEDVYRLSLVEKKYRLEVSSGREFLASEQGTRAVEERKAAAVREFKESAEMESAVRAAALSYYIDAVHLCRDQALAAGVSEEIVYGIEPHIPPRRLNPPAEDDVSGDGSYGDEMNEALSDSSQGDSPFD